MEVLPFDERKKLLMEIIDKHAPAFKYELTRQHLTEDQIEALYPVFIRFLEKALHELSVVLRSHKYTTPKDEE
ncbi:MAG: hypothetical protein JXQ27_03805 [Acidobacteria bacterium]|nr:hypothetical protein [Acidobacteriota bacterium]